MNGSPEGVVEFGHRVYESYSSAAVGFGGPKNTSVSVVPNEIDDDGGEAVLIFTDDTDQNTPESTTNSTGSAPQLEVIPTYNGQPMSVEDVLGIALAIIVFGAEKGPAEPVSRITTAMFDMIPMFDLQGQTSLKYRALVKTMRVLTRWMVAKKRFEEVDIELRRDGVVIGIGRLKKGSRVGSQ